MIDWIWVQRKESRMIPKCLCSAARQVVMTRNVYCWYWRKEDGSNFGYVEFEVLVGNVQ